MKTFINLNVLCIILDIFFSSLAAFFAIIAFTKNKNNLSVIFLGLATLFLYFQMVFRVLKKIYIFSLSDILINNVPLYEYLFYFLPQIFIIGAFVSYFFNKKNY